MRVWFDAPSARDLLFLEAAAARAGRRHEVLLTVSGDPAALAVSRARGIEAARAGGRAVAAAAAAAAAGGAAGGGPGGAGRHILDARVSRLADLSRIVPRFAPDLAVSASSVEAARTAFGLGVPHVAFGVDEPHDDEVVRLTAPLVQKMIIPRRSAAAPYARRGLSASDLLRFGGTAASVTAARRPAAPEGPALRRLGAAMPKGAVLARPPLRGGVRWAQGVAKAARGQGKPSASGPPAVAVLARPGQAADLRAALGAAARIVPDGRYDGMYLIGRCGALVGAAGSTMLSEAALSGAPSIAYGGAPRRGTHVARLARLRLLRTARSAGGLRAAICGLLSEGREARAGARARARAEMSSMEGPFAALARAARAVTGRSL